MKKSTKAAGAKKTDVVERVIKQYTSDFGEGIFWDLSKNEFLNVPFIPTKLISLNWLFGCGGMPKSRAIELSGKESSGKTTLAHHLVACAQSEGLAAYIDTENAYDVSYAERCGVDKKRLVLAQPDYAEQAWAMVESFVQDKKFSIVVLDSTAALSPKAETDGEMGDQYMGLAARVNSQAMRRLSPMLKSSNAVVVFINQIRANLSGYGMPEETGGGMALRHALQVRIRIKPREKIQSRGRDIGYFAEMKTLKNKVATPFRMIKIPVLFGYGFIPAYELVTLAVESKTITKGKSYKLKNTSLGLTWIEASKKLTSNAKIHKFVVDRIVQYLDTKTTIENADISSLRLV